MKKPIEKLILIYLVIPQPAMGRKEQAARRSCIYQGYDPF